MQSVSSAPVTQHEGSWVEQGPDVFYILLLLSSSYFIWLNLSVLHNHSTLLHQYILCINILISHFYIPCTVFSFIYSYYHILFYSNYSMHSLCFSHSFFLHCIVDGAWAWGLPYRGHREPMAMTIGRTATYVTHVVLWGDVLKSNDGFDIGYRLLHR